jgi:hypothetical protein
VSTTVPVTVFDAGAAALDEEEADEPDAFFAVALLLEELPRVEVEALPEAATEPDVPVWVVDTADDEVGDPRDSVLKDSRPTSPAIVDKIAKATRRMRFLGSEVERLAVDAAAGDSGRAQ